MVLSVFYWILLVVYLVACFGLIAVVLLQKGKGVGFAGAFGVGGGSDTLFGPRSAKSMPQKLTYIAAALFMILSLMLSIMSTKVSTGVAPELEETPSVISGEIESLMQVEGTPEEAASDAPAEEAAAEAAPAVDAAPAETDAEAAPATEEAAPAPQ